MHPKAIAICVVRCPRFWVCLQARRHSRTRDQRPRTRPTESQAFGTAVATGEDRTLASIIPDVPLAIISQARSVILIRMEILHRKYISLKLLLDYDELVLVLR